MTYPTPAPQDVPPAGQPQQQPVPPQQYSTPPVQPKKARKAVRDGIIIAAVIVVGLIGIRAYNSANRSGDGDVSIDSCTSQSQAGGTYGVAAVSITNHGDSPKSYVVTVVFESSDGGTQYGTDVVTVNDLAPGQSTTQNTLGTVEVPGDPECGVSHVSTF